jgi:uncharacterized protein
VKVLLTGGTGLIGRALSRRLSQDGDEIVILSRRANKPNGLPDCARVVQWDSKTGEGWSHELQDTDVIVNLAGENVGDRRWTASIKQQIYDSRVDAGRAIVDAVEREGRVPSRLIQASGINYYGHRWDKQITESEPSGEGFLAQVCVDWERSTEPLEWAGTSRAITRNAVVLSAGEGALPELVRPFRFFAGGRIGSGYQGFSWIHLEDHIEALRFLLHNDSITGPVNLASPNPVSNREFAQTLSEILNRPAWFPVPAAVLRIVVGEFADHLIYGQFVVPKRLLDAGFEFRFPTLEPALRDLLVQRKYAPA